MAEPRYLASGAACPCARPPRRLGSPSRPGPALGALAVWPRIQTAWCSPPLPRRPHSPLPPVLLGGCGGDARQRPRRALGARRQLLTLGVAEVSRRGSRLRSAEQRRRLPRAEPLGPQEEPEEEEEEENWGSAARPHNVQGAGRRRRGTCAPRRAGRPVLAGIAERLLEWGAGGRRRGGGGPRVLRCSSTQVPASRRRGEEKAEGVGTASSQIESAPWPPVRDSSSQRRRERWGSPLRSRHHTGTGFPETPCPGDGERRKFSPFPGVPSLSLCRLLSPFRISLPRPVSLCRSVSVPPLWSLPPSLSSSRISPFPFLFLCCPHPSLFSFPLYEFLSLTNPFFWFLTSESGPAQERLPFLHFLTRAEIWHRSSALGLIASSQEV